MNEICGNAVDLDIDSFKPMNFEQACHKYSALIPKKPSKYKFKSLCRVFADRLLDPVTKSEIVAILDAMKGAGKSVSALALCEGVAKELSMSKYGDVSHWKEFFDPEKNIAIITPESIHTVLKHLEKENQVILLDDAGASIGNRDSSSKSNKLVGKLLQTMRIKSACIIITVPAAKLVDLQMRELSTHFLHIEESHHNEGYNLMSCKRVWITNSAQYWHIHLTVADCGGSGLGASNTSITRWIVTRPTEETLKLYEKKRLELTEQQIRETQMLLDKEREKMGLDSMQETKVEFDMRVRNAAERYFGEEDSIRGLAARYKVSRPTLTKMIEQMKKEGWRKRSEEVGFEE